MLSYVALAAPYLLLRPAKPDVVISFHSIPSGLAAFPLSWIRGVPHITLLRGGDVPGWLPGKLAFYHRVTLPINRLVVHQSAATLANSDGLRDLAQPSFPRKRIGVLANGVDCRAYAPPREGRADRPDRAPVMLFAGRITEQKGIDTLLRALARPECRQRPWRLDIAGDGPMLATYVEMAKDLGLFGRIKFHGWLSRADVRRLYNDADMLVFPSRYEGMPNVVLEAAACGLPVIGTRIAGTEEIVEEGMTGHLITVDDESALASAITRLLDDPAHRLSLGAEARRRAQQRWSWAARALELHGLIEKILGGGNQE